MKESEIGVDAETLWQAALGWFEALGFDVRKGCHDRISDRG